MHAFNPFRIDFDRRKELIDEDYLLVQQKLERLYEQNILYSFLAPNENFWIKNLSFSRCTAGLRIKMIVPEMGLYPKCELIKINKGGDRCIVSFASYNGKYSRLMEAIPKALQETGFNGYFYYRVGGFPNPTGEEIQFAGVPYCFKIFMLKEAQMHGFDKLLWMDSSLFPLNDPSPLFELIEERGALMNGWERDGNSSTIFRVAREFLQDITGTQVCTSTYILGGVFGLDLRREQAQELVQEYYQLVGSGISFLSEFPEEYVLIALLGQPKNKNWNPKFSPENVLHYPMENESLEEMEILKQKGFYFYVRKH